MAFMDSFEKNHDDQKRGREGALAVRTESLEALSALLIEITSIFGVDPQSKGIEITRTNFPTQDLSGNYQAQGLKISFPGRKVVQVKPVGIALGGYAVEIAFLGCPVTNAHTLLHAEDGINGGRAWAFLNPTGRRPGHVERWTREAFEKILEYQVLGNASLR
jgi:hypothetical protein